MTTADGMPRRPRWPPERSLGPLGVEFIADLADDLFKHVLDADYADPFIAFLDDHSQLFVAALETCEPVLE